MSESEESNYMYVGPTLAIIGLKKGAIFKGSVPPPQLANLIQLKPVVGALFIPTNKLAETKPRIDRAGTIENIASLAVTEYGKQLNTPKKKA